MPILPKLSGKKYYTYHLDPIKFPKKTIFCDISLHTIQKIVISPEVQNIISLTKHDGARLCAALDTRNSQLYLCPSDDFSFKYLQHITVAGQPISSPCLNASQLHLTRSDQLISLIALSENLRLFKHRNLNAKKSITNQYGGKFNYESLFIAFNITYKDQQLHVSGKDIYINSRHIIYPVNNYEDFKPDNGKKPIKLTTQEVHQAFSKVSHDKPNCYAWAGRLPNLFCQTIEKKLNLYIIQHKFNFLSPTPETTLPLGWIEQIDDQKSPNIQNIKSLHTDKFACGESHISLLQTQDGKNLIAKIERQVAKGHLLEEYNAYKQLGPMAGIVKVYGLAVIQYGLRKETALIMDEIPGMTIDGFFKKAHYLLELNKIKSTEFWSIVQFFARQMLLTIQSLHNHGIVHNDIKPENIMMDSISGYPILIDLGLHSSLNTKPKGFTNRYKAPELDLSTPSATKKTDIFAAFSTLLYCTEKLWLQKHHAPNSGLILNKHLALSPNMKKVHGMCLCETSYTKFIHSGMNINSDIRSDIKSALSHPFLLDSILDDISTIDIIKKVISLKRYPANWKENILSMKKEEVQQTIKKIHEYQSFLSIRKFYLLEYSEDIINITDRLLLSAYTRELSYTDYMLVKERVHKLMENIKKYIGFLTLNAKKLPSFIDLMLSIKNNLDTFFKNENFRFDEFDRLETWIFILDKLMDIATHIASQKSICHVEYIRFHDIQATLSSAKIYKRKLEDKIQHYLSAANKLISESNLWFYDINPKLQRFNAINPRVKSKWASLSSTVEHLRLINQGKQNLMPLITQHQETLIKFNTEALIILKYCNYAYISKEDFMNTLSELRVRFSVSQQLIRIPFEW